jgi:hypothetical protein
MMMMMMVMMMKSKCYQQQRNIDEVDRWSERRVFRKSNLEGCCFRDPTLLVVVVGVSFV